MLIAVDAQYAEHAVATAVVGFTDWADPDSTLEAVLHDEVTAAPYHPGSFYRRELPFIRAAVALAQRRHRIEAVVVDGHVWLRDGEPGLGARLHAALGNRVAVIGVAKAPFAGGCAIPVWRGGSERPLWVTAAGTSADEAAEHVRAMHGAHRIPTLLKRVDALARESTAPDPVKAP